MSTQSNKVTKLKVMKIDDRENISIARDVVDTGDMFIVKDHKSFFIRQEIKEGDNFFVGDIDSSKDVEPLELNHEVDCFSEAYGDDIQLDCWAYFGLYDKTMIVITDIHTHRSWIMYIKVTKNRKESLFPKANALTKPLGTEIRIGYPDSVSWESFAILSDSKGACKVKDELNEFFGKVRKEHRKRFYQKCTVLRFPMYEDEDFVLRWSEDGQTNEVNIEPVLLPKIEDLDRFVMYVRKSALRAAIEYNRMKESASSRASSSTSSPCNDDANTYQNMRSVSLETDEGFLFRYYPDSRVFFAVGKTAKIPKLSSVHLTLQSTSVNPTKNGQIIITIYGQEIVTPNLAIESNRELLMLSQRIGLWIFEELYLKDILSE